MKNLHNNVVLITGAAGGFGRCLARLLLAEGCMLVLADLRRAELAVAAEAISREAGGTPGRILGFATADLSTPGGADALWNEVGKIAPRVDILVNNAGVATIGRFDAIPQEKWERLMQINLLAPMRLTTLALPQMIARKSGHVVNVSSCAGLVGAQGFGAYAASKFGLRGFSEALSKDVGPLGIDVTVIYPWFARTPILDSEQFGYAKRRVLPDRVLDDPTMVMRALVAGIKRRQLHIYPGRTAQLIEWLRRYAPGGLRLLEAGM
jgi:NAD(P)-dependent dehydrogenase (short-subunit alcohol dehydrogenase family)